MPPKKRTDRFRSVRWVKEAKAEAAAGEPGEMAVPTSDTQRFRAEEVSTKPTTLFRKPSAVRLGEPVAVSSVGTADSPSHVIWIAASAALAIGVLAFVGGMVAGVRLAKPAPEPTTNSSASAGPRMLPEEFQETFTQGLRERANGEPAKALQTFRDLLQKAPGAPSARYAAALAAMEAGETTAAKQWLEASADNGDRASDSFAILAAISSQQAGRSAPEQERLLKNAIAADPMNPSPFIELASLMRYRREPAEAERYLEAARLRLNPVDSHSVIRATLELVRMDQMVTAKLPEPQPATGIADKDLISAYVAMRRGDNQTAAALLTRVQQSMDPDLYAYLINDPAIRKFALEPELVPFFQ